MRVIRAQLARHRVTSSFIACARHRAFLAASRPLARTCATRAVLRHRGGSKNDGDGEIKKAPRKLTRIAEHRERHHT